MPELDPMGKRILAVIRKLALKKGVRGTETIGPDYLALGVVGALGPAAEPHLRNAGITDWASVRRAIPDADADELDVLPSVRANAHLASLLKGELKALLNGQMPPAKAVQDLLRDPKIVADVLRLISDDQLAHGPDIRAVVQKLTLVHQKGYRYGKVRYLVGSESGVSDFATGEHDGEFSRAMDEFYAEQQDARLLLYTHVSGKQKSPFYLYSRKYGPLGANILTALAVNSLTPSAAHGSLLETRELAWTLDPDGYHRLVADVIQDVRQLSMEGQLRCLPEGEHCHLESRLLPAESLIEDLTTYIRDASRCDAW